MNSKIIFAFVTRVTVSLVNFFIIAITAKFLGAEARGNISLILLAITLSQVVHQFIGGNPLVYFAKKTALRNLLIPSYIWAIISAAGITYTLNVIKQIPAEYVYDIFILSAIQSLLATHITILLAYEKIKEQNLITFIQALITISWLCVYIFLLNSRNINDYINALYLSYTICFLISLGFLLNAKANITHEFSLSISFIKDLLNYGLVIQSTNIVQMLNYRLSYFLINNYAGTAALGVFSTAVAIGESVWLFSKSLTNVQYPKIVHETDSKLRIELTIKYAKAGLIGTVLLILPLLIIPTSLFEFIFGKEFSEIKWLIILLTPGLVAMGFTTMFAHYFSGISQNRINLFASGTGLIVTLVAGFVFIPKALNTGACITADLSYLAASLLLLIVFIKSTNNKAGTLFPKLDDLKSLTRLLK
ncbi:MAG: hypothetical protein ABI723_18905 [Bacteroidia bacterium]